MIRFGILLPENGMVIQARDELIEKGEEISYVSIVTNDNVIQKAMTAIEKGANILVARGYQAMVLEKRFSIPIIHVKFTAVEIGLLLKKAKMMCGQIRPLIMIAAFENMFPELSNISELVDADVKVVKMRSLNEIRSIIVNMPRKPDVVIAGKEVAAMAEEMHLKTVYYQTIGESIDEAVKNAILVADALRSQQDSELFLKSLIQNTSKGIIILDRYGQIKSMNEIAQDILQIRIHNVVGKYLSDVMTAINKEEIDKLICNEYNTLSGSVTIKECVFYYNMIAVPEGKKTVGIIMFLNAETLSPVLQLISSDRDQTDRLIRQSSLTGMSKQIMEARDFARSDLPVLIYDPSGDGHESFARYIHHLSWRNKNAFVSIDLGVVEPEKQMEVLFHNLIPGREPAYEDVRGAALRANHGTLFIRHIELLTPLMQRWMYHASTPYKQSMRSDSLFSTMDFRLIASTAFNLSELASSGEFDQRLYVVLGSLRINYPLLKDQKNMVTAMFKKSLEDNQRRYNRILRLTDDAWSELAELPWSYGFIQIQMFSERLVLSAHKKIIDADMIRNQFQDIYGKTGSSTCEKEMRSVSKGTDHYRSDEELNIRISLEKMHGNRQKAAEELGISPSTLWRKIKKYGIDASYYTFNQ